MGTRKLWGILSLLSLLLIMGIFSSVLLGQEQNANVEIFIAREYLILHSLAPTNLSVTGMQFRVLGREGITVTYLVEERFPTIKLNSGLIYPNACYVYRVEGSDSTLPNACNNAQVYPVDVSLSDVFWYDNQSNRLRDIAIWRYDAATTREEPVHTCSATNTEGCRFFYISPIDLTRQAEMTLSATINVVSQTAAVTQTQDAILQMTAQAQQTINAGETLFYIGLTQTRQKEEDQLTQTREAEIVILTQSVLTSVAFARETELAALATPTPTFTNTVPPTDTLPPPTVMSPTAEIPTATPPPDGDTATPETPGISDSPLEVLDYTGSIREIVWSPDGNYILSAPNNAICLWDASTLEAVPAEPLHCESNAHDKQVIGLDWSPDGTRFVSVGEDDVVRLWRLDGQTFAADETELSGVAGHATQYYRDVKWSHNGRFIIAANTQDRLIIWYLDRPERPTVITLSSVEALDLRQDDAYAVAVGSNGVVSLVDVQGGYTRTLGSHQGRAVGTQIDWNDGLTDMFLSVAADNTVRLYSQQPGDPCERGENCPYVRLVRNLSDMTDLHVSPDGKLVAIAARDGVHVLQTQFPYLLVGVYKNPQSAPMTDVIWHPQGNILAGASDSGDIYLWHVAPQPPERLSVLNEWKVSDYALNAFAWGPEGIRMAIVDDNRVLSVWDTSTYTQLAQSQEHTARVQAVAWGNLIATGGCDKTILMWDTSGLAEGRLERNRTLEGNDQCITDIEFNQAGDLLINSDETDAIRIFDWQGGMQTKAVSMNRRVNEIAWNQFGHIAAVSDTGEFVVYDMRQDYAILYRRQPLSEPMLALAWSPDASYLATSSRDCNSNYDYCQVTIWDMSIRGQFTAGSGYNGSYSLFAHKAPVRSLSWSGDFLASLDENGELYIWNGSTGERVARFNIPGGVQVVWATGRTSLAVIQLNGFVTHLQFQN